MAIVGGWWLVVARAVIGSDVWWRG